MSNCDSASVLANTPYERLESWYHQGYISQCSWEAWHYARDVLARGWSNVSADDAVVMGQEVVQIFLDRRREAK